MSQDQRGCFETGLRVFAVVMVLILIFSLPLTLAARSFGRVVFRPAILTTILRNTILGPDALNDFVRSNLLGGEMLAFLGEGEGDEDFGRYFEYLSAGEREEIFFALLPPEWLEQQISKGIRDFIAWIDDDRPYPELVLDLNPVKQNLLGGGIITFLDIVVDSWPSCKPDEVEGLQQAFFEQGELPEALCEPPEPMRSRVVDIASIGFEEQIRDLPDTVPLVDVDLSGEDFQAMKEQLRFFRAITLWGWLLPLSMLGLIMTFAIRTWRDFGPWWGLPLLFGGLGTVFVAFILRAGQEDLVSSLTVGVEMVGSVREVLSGVLRALYSAGLRPLWVQGLLITVGGLILWLAMRRRKPVTQVSRTAMEEEDVQPVETRVIPPMAEEEEPGEPPSGIFG